MATGCNAHPAEGHASALSESPIFVERSSHLESPGGWSRCASAPNLDLPKVDSGGGALHRSGPEGANTRTGSVGQPDAGVLEHEIGDNRPGGKTVNSDWEMHKVGKEYNHEA